MKNQLLLLKFTLLLGFPTSLMYGQNIGINSTGTAPDNSAMLDVSSSNSGLLIPRVALTSLTDATTILNPATSLLIYNTNTGGGLTAGYYYNSGTAASPNWTKFATGSAMTSITATAPVYSTGSSTPNLSLQGTSGGVCYGTGSGSGFSGAGTSGQYLQSTGSGAPTWTTPRSTFAVPLFNGGNAVANSSATFSGGYTVWTSATAPGGSFSNYSLLTGSFYQATAPVNFTRASGWIYTTSLTGTFVVSVYKYSIGSGNCNAQVGTTTSTGTLLGSCTCVAASATTYAGKFFIDLSSSPVALASGDVLVFFVQNTSGGSRTWYTAGTAEFTANVQ